MKKNAMTKIIASLAFFGILLSILWTGLLIIFWENRQQPQEQNFTPEQLEELQQMIDSQSGSILNTWSIEIPTLEEIDSVITQ